MRKAKFELIDITLHNVVGHAEDMEGCAVVADDYLKEHPESEVYAYILDDETQIYIRHGGHFPQVEGNTRFGTNEGV